VPGVTSAQVQEICRRLEYEYKQAFADAGGSGLDAWANNANIGVETRFGDRVGPIWATSVRYRRRMGWFGLFGPLVDVRTLDETERELRREIEDALAKMRLGLRPRTLGSAPDGGPRWR
jgi:hypothetical protein